MREQRWNANIVAMVLATAAAGGMVGGALAEWCITPRVEAAILNEHRAETQMPKPLIKPAAAPSQRVAYSTDRYMVDESMKTNDTQPETRPAENE